MPTRADGLTEPQLEAVTHRGGPLLVVGGAGSGKTRVLCDRLALLLERIDDLTLRRHEIRGNPAPLLATLLARIDRLKDEMIGPDEYRAHAERLDAGAHDDATRAHARREAEFARVYADHESPLRARGAIDAGGPVLTAFDLLHRRPHVRARLSQRFAAVLVDDFQ